MHPRGRLHVLLPVFMRMAAVVSLRCILLGSPLLSMRLAVFTVSPKRQ
jgi:hypothetical protein